MRMRDLCMREDDYFQKVAYRISLCLKFNKIQKLENRAKILLIQNREFYELI